MFARRAVPKGVRKRPNPDEPAAATAAAAAGEAAAEAEGGPSAAAAAAAAAATAARAAATQSDGSDEEHAKIAKRRQPRNKLCKHFLMGRTKNEDTNKEKATDALAQKSNPDLKLDDDARATAVFDVDTERTRDHRAILERNLKINEMLESGELESGVYRGIGAYRRYIKPSEGALSRNKTTGLYGPTRGSNNVRLTMYVDYKPEICKDYKETGYCGYGDCCKFLHDRTDYKEGWQVEKEFEEQQKKKLERLRRQAEGELGVSCSSGSSSEDSEDEEDEDEDGLPFACLSCRERWTVSMDPVVTICKHYFCRSCCINNFKKNRACPQCGADTQGIFNIPHKLIDKIESRNNSNNNNDDSSTNTCCSSSCTKNGSKCSNTKKNTKENNNSDCESDEEEEEEEKEEEEEEEKEEEEEETTKERG